jgi:hypothetical protein
VAQGSSFVTSRSIPCGPHWPDIQGFVQEVEGQGYDVRVVVIVRDQHITALSAAQRRLAVPALVWPRLDRLLGDLPVVWLSYEAVTQIGLPYLRRWCRSLHPGVSYDIEQWAKIEDQNAKYIRNPCR